MNKAQPIINRTLSGLQDPVRNHVGMGLNYFLPADFQAKFGCIFVAVRRG